MKVDIRDRDALPAIPPDALSAYSLAAGWSEIILPRTQRLGDYASVVPKLIDIFTQVAERDELALYYDLVSASRDVVRYEPEEAMTAG